MEIMTGERATSTPTIFKDRVTAHNEAPASIGQKAQPATAVRSRKTAKTVTANEGRGLRSAPHFAAGA